MIDWYRLAQRLRERSEWSSKVSWSELPDDRRERWVRFAKKAFEAVGAEMVEASE